VRRAYTDAMRSEHTPHSSPADMQSPATSPTQHAPLPHSAKIFAPNFSIELGRRIAQSLGVTLAASEEREFEGGEQKMRPLEDVSDCDVFVIASLNGDAQASANDKLCRLLFFIGALKDAGAASVTACVPYLCYSRKDRKTQPHDPVTTRYVAALFEAVGVDRVIVVDVHNEAAFDNAFRCHTLRIEGADVFAPALSTCVDVNRSVVVSPDIGGVKRAQRLREALRDRFCHDVGFAFAEKRRVGGQVSGDAFIGDVRDCDVIIYDDMIVSGTTIARATHAARHAGARKVVVAATHAAFTEDARQLFAANGPDLVLVSDSIALDDEWPARFGHSLRVCSTAEVLGESIRRLVRRANA
jgi:ribose-phosphate pyrophosphokinase